MAGPNVSFIQSQSEVPLFFCLHVVVVVIVYMLLLLLLFTCCCCCYCLHVVIVTRCCCCYCLHVVVVYMSLLLLFKVSMSIHEILDLCHHYYAFVKEMKDTLTPQDVTVFERLTKVTPLLIIIIIITSL